MTEFQAYEFTDVDNPAAWAAEPILRGVREHYGDVVWWRRVYASANLTGPRPLTRRRSRGRPSTKARCWPRRCCSGCARRAPSTDASRMTRCSPASPGWTAGACCATSSRRPSSGRSTPTHAQPTHATFPTVLRGPAGDRVVSGGRSRESYVAAIDAVAPLLEGA